jgi:SAM-dependent methyltransferase
MSSAFEGYAKYYDLLYHDKDYEAECDLVQDLLQNNSRGKVTTILDCACGTGGHAVPLAKRGYKITAFDVSPVMLQQARAKTTEVVFHLMDLRTFDIGGAFDASVCMFAAMNYLTKNSEIQKALLNVRRHLRRDGLFIFDFWNGLAVLRVLPETRLKTVTGDGMKVVRFVQPELDAFNHVCKSHYHLIVTKGDTVLEEVQETHEVRYFFPQEIVHYLEEAAFEVLQVSPFPDLRGGVNETTWNAIAVARAK